MAKSTVTLWRAPSGKFVLTVFSHADLTAKSISMDKSYKECDVYEFGRFITDLMDAEFEGVKDL